MEVEVFLLCGAGLTGVLFCSLGMLFTSTFSLLNSYMIVTLYRRQYFAANVGLLYGAHNILNFCLTLICFKYVFLRYYPCEGIIFYYSYHSSLLIFLNQLI